MKLGTKIAFGFGSVLAIAVALGSLAIWNMNGVKTTATVLASENVPSVQVATEVERDSLNTMYATRGYAFTEDPKFLEQARTNFKDVEKDLKDAKDHAAKYQIAILKDNAEKAQSKAAEYAQLLNDTVAKTEAMGKDKAESLVAADKYMKITYDYVESQDKLLTTAINAITKADADKEALKTEIIDRKKKIGLANDILDLGNWIRTGTWQAIATRDPKLFTETEKKFEQVNAKLDELKSITKQETDLKAIEECRAAGKAYLGCMESFLTSWLAREEIGKKRGEAADGVLTAARNTSTAALESTAKSSSVAASSLGSASLTMIVGLSIGVVVGIVLALFITRSITSAITRISSTLASGSQQTSSAAGQVSSSSQSLAQGASEQAAALEETTSALEEMSSMTKKNAETAQQAASLSSEAQKSAAKGNDAMNKMSTAINDIQKSASETAKIIKVIDEIAFQTNLLALNAAVEAARAGEAGKGFAVVAEEVRNLAMRSAEAAKNTAAMIEESVNNAKNGVAIAVEVGKNLEEITTAATKVNSLVGEIAAASKEQSQGIDQVNTAVSQMDKVTQSNAASAEESASAAEELSSQSVQLGEMVAELVAIVGSAKANAANAAGTPARRPAANHKAPAAQAHTSKVSAKKASARMIPLDADEQSANEDSFAEFSSSK